MSQFDQLLAELQSISTEQETMVKALPAKDGEDDQAIQAAAAEGGDDDDDNEDDENLVDGEGEAAPPPMTKSVTAMIDGEQVEAVDATELLKSLVQRVDASESVVAKALEMTLGTFKAQNTLIKSLQAEVKRLGGQGAGRKAVISITEKPAVGQPAAQPADGLSPADFMAKAHAAFAGGKLSGKELTVADVSIRMGTPVPSEIIAKALS